MSKKKYKPFDLMNGLIEVTTISCSRCDAEDEIQDDLYGAATHFFDEGWRGTDRHTYCPSCAKKYLKTKK